MWTDTDSGADGPADAGSEALARRAALVRLLRGNGSLRSAAVEDAIATVPRHLFLPDTSLADTYKDDAVATKHDERGVAISAASQPSVVAIMLEQLGVLPGQRILEIGAGTGYNAALLARIAGPSGRVTTVDIDADLVERAQRQLRAAGADTAAATGTDIGSGTGTGTGTHTDTATVTAVTTDGALGHPEGAPYDRIVATVGAAVL